MKTELSFDTQSELVRTKEELIANQRIIIENLKKSDCSSINTSNGSEHPTSVPGLQESFICLSNIALHGVVLSGFLVWANIQRRTIAENIWKEEALKKFTKEELTEAKEMLWDVADKAVLGKMTKRQGPTKPILEINDICVALKTLSENKVMPIFICTCNMIMQTPLFNIDLMENSNEVIANSLKILEDTVNTAFAPINKERQNKVVKDKETMTYTINNRGISTQENGTYVSCADMVKQPAEQELPPQNGMFNKINKQVKPSGVLHGTAPYEMEDGQPMAADVDIVMYGVAKDITALQVSNYIEKKDS